MKRVPGAIEDPGKVSGLWIEYASAGDQIRAYLARPQQGTLKGGLIVIHEAFGLNDHIQDLARRFANLGLVALAPDLYSRAVLPDAPDMPAVRKAMFGLSDSQVIADLRAAMDYLKSETGVTAVASIGFCSGGRQSLLFAFSGAGLAAAIDCWGGFISCATQTEVVTEQRPMRVLNMSDGLDCPLFAAFGAEDENPPLADAEELRRRTQGKQVTLKIYQDAGHAFLADYRPTYREGPAFALWEDIKQFLREHLPGVAT